MFVPTNGTPTGYSYNADGIRTSKNLYDTEASLIGNITYTLDGSTIVAENRLGTKIYYTYDDKGAIMGMYYGGQNYIFSKNLQGDVIGVYNESRQLVAKYSYNAYGEIMSITDASGNDVSSNSAHIANVNPFRYRGYTTTPRRDSIIWSPDITIQWLVDSLMQTPTSPQVKASLATICLHIVVIIRLTGLIP